MRNYEEEIRQRTAFIRWMLEEAHGEGIVFGNSGGKDCALVGALCRMACENVTGVIMPCQSRRNYQEDAQDALASAEKFGFRTLRVDVTSAKEALAGEIEKCCGISHMAGINMNPRLRMIVLYTIAQSGNCLVAGTGNRSERSMGYFTKWGDGACDFNPIGDLTATEVFEFLRYLDAPQHIIEKAPSAGLYDGQTDEQEMGIAYADLDRYLLTGEGAPEVKARVDGTLIRTAHKRRMPPVFGEEQ